jgi:capsular exopolysaccharide synthesis family protein
MKSSQPSKTNSEVEEIDIQKYWLVLKRHWKFIPITCGVTVSLASLYVALQPKTYKASAKLLVKADRSAQLTGVDSRTGEIKALTDKADPLSTEKEILTSESILEAVANRLNLKDSDGKAITGEQLGQNLSVKPITATDLLQVEYQAEKPDIAAKVVNQLLAEYLRNNVQVNQSEAVAARQFIVAELPQAEAAVAQAEENLRRFREKNGLVDLTQEAAEGVKNLALLDQNISQSKALLLQSEARVSQLRQQVGMDVKTALRVNALNQSKAVQQAVQDWRQTQALLAQQRTIYQDSHPEISQLKAQVRAAKAILQGQIRDITGQQFTGSVGQLQLSETQQSLVRDLSLAEVERMSLRQGLASLLQSRAAALAKYRSIPRLEAAQRELQRKVDAAQKTYETLLTKFQELQVAENQNIRNARIVSPAIEPAEPVASLSLLILLASGATGVLLGLALAFLADLSDRSVKTLQEVKDLMPYPVLGMIPQVKLLRQNNLPREPQSITQDYYFGAQDAYHMLQTNLRFLPTAQAVRSIVVTSSTQLEGKSTVASNLALAMAQGNRRVLLVDADMRNACQHEVWRLNNRAGLSNLLLGEVQINETISTVRPNLHVMTAGTITPNPVVLLDSNRMSKLVEHLMGQYDFVIFDAPPLLDTADSTVLSRLVDGILLVARLGVTNVEQVKEIRQLIRQSGQQVLGMVINGMEPKPNRNEKFYDQRLEAVNQAVTF